MEIDALFKGCTLHRGKVHFYLDMIFDFNMDGEVRIAMDGYIEDCQGQHLHLQNQTFLTLTYKRNHSMIQDVMIFTPA